MRISLKRIIAGWAVVTAAGLAVMSVSAADAEPPVRVAPNMLWRSYDLRPVMVTSDLAMDRIGKPWAFAEDERCNFTYFSPEAKKVEFGAEGLSFTTSGERVIVGWGNYDGRQNVTERLLTYSGWNDIEMTVSQSAESSVWRLDLWNEGRRGGGRIAFWSHPHDTKTVSGTDPQTVRFRAFRMGGADGFGLSIKGPEDNRIRIEDIRITQTMGQGYFRKEIDLPEGRIWRAVAEKIGSALLFVNGEPVDTSLGYQGNAGGPVDLAPYLNPGRRNVICLQANQSPQDRHPPNARLQGAIVMKDGERFALDTDGAWSVSGHGQDGWRDAGFDSREWADATVSNPDLGFNKRRWPVYDGRLLLENPGHDPKLYFDTAAPVRLIVRVPEGLERKGAAVRWVLRAVERDGERPIARRGETEQAVRQPETGSLIYMVDAGSLDAGVYTIELSLVADGAVLERRFEEPLSVIGKLPMKEAAGGDYEEGLDLHLENVIDFTDPDDPHLWVESRGIRYPTRGVDTPNIVTKGGIVYREVTDSGSQAKFSYRFEFEKPYSWYLMVLEYPNDADRWIGVSVTVAKRGGGNDRQPWRRTTSGGYSSQSGPSLITGDKYPLDGTMREMRWLHWANPEIHTLDIVNLKRGQHAAAARARIYRVKNPLPAMRIETSGERFFGIYTEDTYKLGVTFGDTEPSKYQGRYDAMGYDMVARFTERLRWHFDTCRNYTEYLRFTGQNLHVEGAFHYSEETSLSFWPAERVPGDGRLLQDERETLLRFLERNGIGMYSFVEYVGHSTIRNRYGATDRSVREGAETVRFVSREGKQGGWHLNPNHPEVEAGYLEVAEDLALKFAFSPAWRGIFYAPCTVDGGWGPSGLAPHQSPLDYDYSDVTIAAFERDTGMRVPGEPDDPNRFEKRYLFLTSDTHRERWIEWRCRQMGRYLIQTRDKLREFRPDLNVLCGYHITAGPIRWWLNESGQSYGDYMRLMGMDPSVVKDETGIWFGRFVYPMGPAGDDEPFQWEHFVGPEPNAYYDVSPNRMTVLCTCWHELPTRAPGTFRGGDDKVQPPDWPIPGNVSRFISQAHDDNVMEPFTQAMIGTDPDILLFGFTDMNIINSREQQVRDVAGVLTALPGEQFSPVGGTTDFKHNLAIRELRQGRDYWFYVANPGYWPIEGEIVLSGKANVVRPNDGRAIETREADGKTVVPVTLQPYGMAAFKLQGRRIAVESWSNDPLPDSELAHMRGIMAGVRELMEDRQAALAITREDRDLIRGVLARSEKFLDDGEYAAAWSELTNWRFWTLKRNLESAHRFSMRLPDRPQFDRLDSWERPVLQVAAVEGEPPEINGRLDDRAWETAPASYRFLSIGRGDAPYLGMPVIDTAVQACHDGENLYLAFRMADPDLQSLRTKASLENPVEVLRMHDDAIVIFLNPGGDRIRQFAINAAGVKYFSSSGAWGVTDQDILKRPWHAAAGSGDNYWILEVAIPFASLDEEPPLAGSTWRANFIRRFREFEIPESYWARIKTGWSDPERYGTLSFR